MSRSKSPKAVAWAAYVCRSKGFAALCSQVIAVKTSFVRNCLSCWCSVTFSNWTAGDTIDYLTGWAGLREIFEFDDKLPHFMML